MNPFHRHLPTGQIAPRPRASAATSRRRGFSLTELMIVVAITGVFVSMSAGRFFKAVEQSHADIAAANLRAVWTAERIYWLEYGAYTDDLSELETLDLVDPTIISATSPYQYQVQAADANTFTATATRSGSGRWSGEFIIDESGTLAGDIDGGDTIIHPGFL